MTDVLRIRNTDCTPIVELLNDEGLSVEMIETGRDIPGSHWGDDEAGLIRNTLFARPDTPVHSLLHEGCHYLLMSEERRVNLHTNAGGSATEENAVCYLQILLSDKLPEVGRKRMMADMDSWGYSFRLGSTSAWFAVDAEDAIAFLKQSKWCELLE